MHIGIVSSTPMTTESLQAARFVLESIISRYSSDSNSHVLLTGGRDGVEVMAEKIAKKSKWKTVVKIEKGDGSWFSYKRKAIDEKIAETADVLISIEPRNSNGSYAVNKMHTLGKVSWEIFL